jgi:hypothetical protein
MQLSGQHYVYLAAQGSPLKSLVRGLAIIVVLQSLMTFAADRLLAELLVVICPIIVFIFLGSTAFRIVNRSPFILLSPLPYFLAYSAFVFGIGPLYHWLAPADVSRVSSTIFSSDPIDHAWVALLNSWGLLFTLIGFILTLSYLLSKSRLTIPKVGLVPPLSSFIRGGYSALGLAITLRLSEFLLSINLQIPGFLSFTDRAGWVGILLLSIAGANRRSSWFLLLSALAAALESIFGLVIGIRNEAIMPIVLWFVGCYIGNRSAKFLAAGLVIVASFMIFITPLVKEIRLLTWGSYSYSSGISSLNAAFERQSLEDSSDDPALFAVWRRLDYSPWQAEMMQLFDSGSSGNTYQYIFWTFVPRFLVPSKPKLEIGDAIGYAVQGFSQSSSFSSTVFGEMYWNGGWFSLIFSSLVYGFCLCLITSATLWLFTQNNLLALLIGSTGILFGFVVDETFSVSVVGQAVIFFVIISVYSLGVQLLTSRILRKS